MTIAKTYPSDPSMRETRVADGEALPVTAPTAAPGGDPSPNSVRAREEGPGVKEAGVDPEPETFTVEEPAPKKAPAKKAAAKKAAAKKAAK
jgi:hypothetical protein